MFERFTDRARKIMALAKEDAQRFSHGCIGTEHILLALIGEGSGVAANVLANLGVSPERIRVEVQKMIENSDSQVMVDKRPQTAHVQKVIEFAMEESERWGHDYVGSEHLLLGLVRERGGVAGQVLHKLGVRPDQVLQEMLVLLRGSVQPESNRPSRPNEYPFSQIEGWFKYHPLVRLYRKLINRWDRQKALYVNDENFGLAADARQQRDDLEYALRRLLEKLATDRTFGSDVLADDHLSEEP